MNGVLVDFAAVLIFNFASLDISYFYDVPVRF